MKKNYASFIRPISAIVHLLLLNAFFYWWKIDFSNNPYFYLYLNVVWLLIASFSKIYSFNRNIKTTKVAKQLTIQFVVFTLSVYAFYSWSKEIVHLTNLTKLLLTIYTTIIVFRIVYFSALRRYRIKGGNFKKVVFIGSNAGLQPMADFMMNRYDFGYKIMGFFSNKENPNLSYNDYSKSKNKKGELDFLGNVDAVFDFVVENNIEEIYCSLSEVSQENIKKILDFGDSNYIEIKLIPDSHNVLSKNMHLEYYGLVPVLSPRELPFDKPFVKFFKRLFDIVFSLAVIVFVLSWLSPLLYILIKKESKGPLFFKQVRDGLKGGDFICYKYRSMGVNNRSELDQTTKGDARITKIGKFIRKTSIDELPQFFNVLKGEMSVVGPRPHMLSQSELFVKIVDKYMVRHFVKPGITGLAQVKGYRGEIASDQDIINRVKYDIFYIENWSFIMDINIIIRTIINVFSGEENAY